jgi:hypothetical protein
MPRQDYRFNACVAKQLADSGYCSTKKLHYHGVRDPIGRRTPGSLPIPEYIGVTGASGHDDKIFDQIRPQLHSNELCMVIKLINGPMLKTSGKLRI